MVAIRFEIESGSVFRQLRRVSEHMADSHPALEEFGPVLLRSIARNFKEGGRPEKWRPSRRAKGIERGKTLIDTGRLRNSMTCEVNGNVLTAGTNVVYARIHQLGGKINKEVVVRAHRRLMTKAFGKPIPARTVLVRSSARKMNTTIPARPFLMVQEADRRILTRILGDYVTHA